MQPRLWKIIKEEIRIWRVGAFPGIVVIALVIVARLSGSMQSLEWLAFDSFLRLRPEEPIDERIIIVGINQDDRLIDSSVSDRDLAALLWKLHRCQPRVIGLDIYRDFPVNPGHTELLAAFKNIKNLIVIEKVFPKQIAPPPNFSFEQIGFADQITDADGKLRRSLLITPTFQGEKLSLSLRLAEIYLAQKNISLKNSISDRTGIQFGNTPLPKLFPNSGGYVRTDVTGVQVLLNFRSGRKRFKTISLNDIKSNKFNSEWLRDRIVIVGITSPSRKDLITTSRITSNQPTKKQVYGVEIQAHAVSQIVSAVLDDRPLLNTWSDEWEYLWIFAWGFLGIAIARLSKSLLANIIIVITTTSSLIVASYFLLTWGWWVPVIPTIIVLTLNGIELTALYQCDQALRLGIKTRQDVIERTFETIHNGPLQSLAKVLKMVRCQDLPIKELLPELEKELEKLNHELRGIYDFLQREPPNQDSSLYLGNTLVLNLQDPLHEILYQVYSHTLARDFPCFRTIKVKIRTFEPIDERYLSIEQKQGLCRFLEEALCNVGKHAIGVTRLEVTCFSSEGWYTLSIIDDGLGVNSSREGRGTQQFRNLAKQLKGKFQRVPLSSKGTICELSWPVTKFWFSNK
ncbi:CHASE2 domain-containing protein [Desmonostoc muscorum LEGE 12446]|uniref:CHASE2 domain-containing protein n=1 Tax=Desmonostoc muscorum LEGE 12446 TaxID=1828758 RepID=A0A8J7DFY0_DESMC|nr:CHASE2 domain-containing protein [Desmonostoc muscorum]MCF2145144.1 CHASE2 domain-containing protein [Desmonostoc muscorum LEGE 12446]